jgi:hypothetical protein
MRKKRRTRSSHINFMAASRRRRFSSSRDRYKGHPKIDQPAIPLQEGTQRKMEEPTSSARRALASFASWNASRKKKEDDNKFVSFSKPELKRAVECDTDLELPLARLPLQSLFLSPCTLEIVL